MNQDHFFLAFGNIKHRGLRSWLTILGIFIGIAAVVSLISLGNGLQTAITAQFSTLSVDRLVIQNAGTGFGPPGSTTVTKLTDHDVKIIESVSGIDRVISRLIRIAKVEYKDMVGFNYLTNIPADQKSADLTYESLSITPSAGRLIKAGETGKVVLGETIANGKTNGFGKDLLPGSRLIINGKSFEVAGTVKRSSSFQINFVIFMGEDDLKSLLNIKDEWDIIVAKVQDKNQIGNIAKVIEEKLRRDRNEKLGEEDFTVQTPIQVLGTVNLILSIINYIVVGIAAISLLIGGVGITNTMYTSVLERTKEIGIMKAIGAKNKDVLYIFVIESGLLGLVGGVVGAVIGLSMAFGVSAIANSAFGSTILKVSISWPLLIGAVLFAFFLGLAAGILPAFQASKLKPTEALRG